MPTEQAKPDLCISCYAIVSWRYDDKLRVWQAFEAGTKKPHKCVTGGD